MFKMQENHFGKETEKLRIPTKSCKTLQMANLKHLTFQSLLVMMVPNVLRGMILATFVLTSPFLCIVLGLFREGQRLNSGQVM